MIDRLTRLLALMAALCAPLAASAGAYPDKPIHIVVPYPPGGFNDTLGRLVGAKLSAAWGQPVIVENRPGAGTIVGTSTVAKAPADGYTLLVAQFPFASNPSVYRTLPYDTRRDFAPIVLAGQSPMLLTVRKDSPFQTVHDLVQAAKKSPGTMNYGSSGTGSSNHLAMALFERMAGIHMVQIPYKGSSPMMTDLAGGQVEAAFDAIANCWAFVQSGKVRPIAVADTRRTPLLPDLPTVAESGVPGYDVSSWHGFVAPAGTPPEILDKLNMEINAILRMDDVRDTFKAQGVVPAGGSRDAFGQFIAQQMAKWRKVVDEAGIQPQ